MYKHYVGLYSRNSHVEQFSLTLRLFDIEEMAIKEHFIMFKPISDSSVEGIYESLLNKLKICKLDFSNCRGQGYEYRADMKGKNKGV